MVVAAKQTKYWLVVQIWETGSGQLHGLFVDFSPPYMNDIDFVLFLPLVGRSSGIIACLDWWRYVISQALPKFHNGSKNFLRPLLRFSVVTGLLDWKSEFRFRSVHFEELQDV
jgi:hypothetical protein